MVSPPAENCAPRRRLPPPTTIGELHAAHAPLELLGDGLGLVEVDAELAAAVAERFAAQLQEDAAIFGGQDDAGIGHGSASREWSGRQRAAAQSIS